MTAKLEDLVTAALKILGLILALRTARGVAQLIAWRLAMDQAPIPDGGSYVFWTGLGLIAEGAVALVLLLQTERASRWILGGQNGDVELSSGSRELVAVALTVAGLVVALLAIPHLVSAIAEALWLLGDERRPLHESMLWAEWPIDLYWLASLCVGLWVARAASRRLDGGGELDSEGHVGEV